MSKQVAFVSHSWLSRAAVAALCAVMQPAVAAENYSVVFDGAPAGLQDQLELVSTLAVGKREYPTSAAIVIIARRDVEALEKAMKAAGYYAGQVTFQLNNDVTPPRVTFTMEPGPLFKISAYKIEYADSVNSDRPNSFSALGLPVDNAADGASLQRAQQSFLRALWEKGFPAAGIIARRADAKIERGEATAVFTFESGPRAVFGELRIDGNETTAPVYLEKLKPWAAGELFDRSKLITYRSRLTATGLFSSIDIAPGAIATNGEAPIILRLTERKRRTIGAGASYSTSEGPGGRLFFEYRDLFHRGERARIELEGSEIEQSLTFDFSKPLAALPGKAFAQLAFRNETTDAFDARTIEISGGLSRKWLNDRLETRGGLALETSKVRTVDTEERTYFISSPVSATWDTEDSVLAPTKGVRATLSVSPYAGSDYFTRSEFTGRTRVNFGPNKMFTAAFRTRLGSTLGSSLADLPSNKRYYAGGGASVRGYDFQAAGPLDADNEPIGGRSVVEGAIEARARVTKNIQLAAFVDAGSVSPNAFPDFAGDYFTGVGGGIRYFTAVGPIRLDIATPLDRRDSDRAIQFYVSLGQPF